MIDSGKSIPMPYYCAQIIFISLIFIGLSSIAGEKYKGKPWKNHPQQIPGKIQCEFYDQGGEGIAYHDSDSINSGSGQLNPADGNFLNEFRMKEAVDISYTKFRTPPIDNNPFNLVEPEKDQLYVGWTKPGEWIKYTIHVKKSGTYQVGIMFTSNKDGKISLSVDEADLTGPLTIPSTASTNETVPWRQWHHWNYLEGIARITLKKGVHVLTLHTSEIGDMNYDYLNFAWIN
jgi:hypothetical protein